MKYGEHDLQELKVIKGEKNPPKSIVFIHGGAWRDANNTYDDFNVMAELLASQIDSNFFSINYRLSPKFKHPVHILDLVKALSFLQSHNLLGDNVHLIGHSVGASMILQLFDARTIILEGIRELERFTGEPAIYLGSPHEVETLLKKSESLPITKAFFIDGIYDNVRLIEEYGLPYKSFIDDAFVSKSHYTEAFQTSRHHERGSSFTNSKFLRQLVIFQSLDDELLSLKQSEILSEYLKQHEIKFSLSTGNWGKHEEVYSNHELSNILVLMINST